MTTIEIPTDIPTFKFYLLIKAIPILMPKEMPISKMVNNHMQALRILF